MLLGILVTGTILKRLIVSSDLESQAVRLTVVQFVPSFINLGGWWLLVYTCIFSKTFVEYSRLVLNSILRRSWHRQKESALMWATQ